MLLGAQQVPPGHLGWVLSRVPSCLISGVRWAALQLKVTTEQLGHFDS